MKLAPRDASWWECPGVGRGGRYHVPNGVGSLCGVPMLRYDLLTPLEKVPKELRCRHAACNKAIEAAQAAERQSDEENAIADI